MRSEDLRARDARTLDDRDDETAMDDKLRELGTPLVRVAPVPDQQLREIAELVDREIGGERGLTTLLADDADACERGTSGSSGQKKKRRHLKHNDHEQDGRHVPTSAA